jgi:hypothetical protein
MVAGIPYGREQGGKARKANSIEELQTILQSDLLCGMAETRLPQGVGKTHRLRFFNGDDYFEVRYRESTRGLLPRGAPVREDRRAAACNPK